MWYLTDKGNINCRLLADRHYSRQTIGAFSFTRPGYNQVLYTRDSNGGEAVFVWFRPKWEDGIERFDKLRAIECTIFRNETIHLSSLMILEAEQIALSWNRFTEAPDGFITSINSEATRKHRSKKAVPGACFVHAGWKRISHAVGAADVWLAKDIASTPVVVPVLSKPAITYKGKPVKIQQLVDGVAIVLDANNKRMLIPAGRLTYAYKEFTT